MLQEQGEAIEIYLYEGVGHAFMHRPTPGDGAAESEARSDWTERWRRDPR